MLPNLFTMLAQAPAALNGYLQLSEALRPGRLISRQREIIAIAVAQENACGYCRSVHVAMGRGAGMSSEDIDKAVMAAPRIARLPAATVGKRDCFGASASRASSARR